MEQVTQPASAGAAPEGVGEGVDNDQPAAVGSEDAGHENDQLVTVKVNGVDQQIPLSEAVAGYQRQADYTRKTTELSQRAQQLEQAEALYRAFESDPIGTLDLLNEQFESLRDNGSFSTEEPDPVQARLDAHEEFIQSQRESAAVAQVNDEIATLQKQYGNFDREALLQHAIDLGGVPLKAALADMLLDGFQPTVQQNQQITQQKRDAFQPAGGSHAAGSTSSRRADAVPKSIKEALEWALDDEGLTSLPPIDFGV